MERKLPIGIQNFREIRDGGYLYADKTAFIYRLAAEGKAYFLSRPRRFGKSLLVSAMDAYFSGQKDYFKGLAIEKLENEHPTDLSGTPWVAGPVVRLDFSIGSYGSEEELRDSLSDKLHLYELEWGADEALLSLPARFAHLIAAMYKKTGVRVAVLIDEYDKPLLSTMFSPDLNSRLRELLKSFYGVLKGVDEYTKFVFLTGVTKFSHVSIFSDLNQLRDISLLSAYNEICGLTQAEIAGTFRPEIDAVGAETGCSGDEALAALADWYDGYRFARTGNGIFNPFSVLNALANRAFGSYWFDTATPSFLVETVKRTDFDIRSLSDGVEAQQEDFMSCRADISAPIPLFYQSGYITIKDYDPAFGMYTLAFPNKEVRYSFLSSLLPLYTTPVRPGSKESVSAASFAKSLSDGNVDAFMTKLKALLASVPYDATRGADQLAVYEHTYSTALYLIFTLCGQYLRTEVHMAGGRSDAVAETADTIYVFEFKMKAAGSAQDALDQIDRKGYAEPFAASGKKIVKLGVVFDPDSRNIAEYKVR